MADCEQRNKKKKQQKTCQKLNTFHQMAKASRVPLNFLWKCIKIPSSNYFIKKHMNAFPSQSVALNFLLKLFNKILKSYHFQQVYFREWKEVWINDLIFLAVARRFLPSILWVVCICVLMIFWHMVHFRWDEKNSFKMF